MTYEKLTRYAQLFQHPDKVGGWRAAKSGEYLACLVYSEQTEDFLQDFANSNLMNKHYSENLEAAGLSMANLESVNVSTLSADMILNMLTAIVRQERFSEGLIYTHSLAIATWLERLKELDRKTAKP